MLPGICWPRGCSVLCPLQQESNRNGFSRTATEQKANAKNDFSIGA